MDHTKLNTRVVIFRKRGLGVSWGLTKPPITGGLLGVSTKNQNLRVEIHYVLQFFDSELASGIKKKSEHDHKSAELFAKRDKFEKIDKILLNNTN